MITYSENSAYGDIACPACPTGAVPLYIAIEPPGQQRKHCITCGHEFYISVQDGRVVHGSRFESVA